MKNVLREDKEDIYIFFYYSFIIWSDVFVQCIDIMFGVQTNNPFSPLLNQSFLHPSGLVPPSRAPRRGEQQGSASCRTWRMLVPGTEYLLLRWIRW